MSVWQLAALARRHVLVVCLILVVTVGIAIDFRYARVTYEETATVAVEPENFNTVEPLSADENYLQNNSLIITCQLLVMRLTSPQGEAQLREVGVTGDFAVSIVNSSNLDTPTYGYPDLLVSVSGNNPVTTHDQWIETRQVITSDIAKLQAGKHFPTNDVITTYVLSDSGPVSQRGSMARVYAALMLLALVAMYLACRFLDSHSRVAITLPGRMEQ